MRPKASVPYLFLTPALAIFMLFVLYPAIEIFLLSFRNYSFVADGGWIGWKNYVRLFSDKVFYSSLLNSFLYLIVTPALVVCSLAIAFLLEVPLKGMKTFRALSILPVVTPMIVVGIIWRWLLNEDVGLLNYVAVAIGLTEQKISWLSSYPLNLFSVMFVTLWRGIGYYAVIFLAALMGIPKELEEAAYCDGATLFQRIIHIKIPLLKPTIALVGIISSISALKVFDELYVIIGGSPSSEKTLVPFIYQTAFIDFRLGYASAMSVILFVITLAFSYFNMKHWKES